MGVYTNRRMAFTNYMNILGDLFRDKPFIPRNKY